MGKDCCPSPSYVRAYTRIGPLRLKDKYCLNCGEVTADFYDSPFAGLYEWLLRLFWNGEVVVVDKNCSEHGQEADL